MTVTTVTLSEIQATLAQMQASAAAAPDGPSPGFATDLADATGLQSAGALLSDPSAADGAAGNLASADAAPADQSDLLAIMLAAGGTGAGASGVGSGSTAPVTSSVTGSDVVTEAERFEGTPYVWGGTSPSGFDCSGLVQYVYGQLGISLPRTSEEQSQVGAPVPGLSEAQPGDLLFFAGSDGTPSAPGHVGIYVGDGQMIDAPHTGTSVQLQPVPTDQVVAIRRVLPGAPDSEPSETTAGADAGSTLIGNVPVPDQYVATIEQSSATNAIPASLLSALLYHESRFETDAVSQAGAEGIAQFMPATAAGMGIDPMDPIQSIQGAAQLLGNYTRQFGSYADALAAYDAGPGAVEQYGGVPPYAETQAYVPSVLSLAGLSAEAAGSAS